MKKAVLFAFVGMLIFCRAGISASLEDRFDSKMDAYDRDTIVKNYPDSSDYWVNVDYLDEIKSGGDVCGCLSKNPFVLLHIDSTFETIIIQSSVYHFGLETTAELRLKKNDSLNKSFTVAEEWPTSSELNIIVNQNDLLMTYGTLKYKFVKQRLKTLDIPSTPKGIFVQSSDIFDQRNRLNALSILAYISDENPDNFLAASELSTLVHSNKVFIGCSDDYHLNSMRIEGDTSQHFILKYETNSLTFYETPGSRSRYENINLEDLKSQVFFKKE